LEVPSVAQWV